MVAGEGSEGEGEEGEGDGGAQVCVSVCVWGGVEWMAQGAAAGLDMAAAEAGERAAAAAAAEAADAETARVLAGVCACVGGGGLASVVYSVRALRAPPCSHRGAGL